MRKSVLLVVIVAIGLLAAPSRAAAPAALGVSPAILPADLAPLVVSWQSSVTPTPEDYFIALYADVKSPNGQFLATSSCSSASKVASADTMSITLTPPNLRSKSGFQARLFSKSATSSGSGDAQCTASPGTAFNCVLVAASPAVPWASPEAGVSPATQVRLSLGNRGADGRTPVVVTWVSADSGTPFVDASPVSAWTDSATSVAPLQRFNGTTRTYGAADMCGAPANESYPWFYPDGVDAGFIHSVEVSGLESNTRYSYAVGVTGLVQRSGISAVAGVATAADPALQFTAPPSGADESPSAPISFIALGDIDHAKAFCESCDPPASHTHAGLGAAANIAAIAKEAGADEVPRFVLAIGDLSYARGSAWRWDVWSAQIESFASHVPTLVSLGNHEADHVPTPGSQDPSGLPPFAPSWGNFGDDSFGECAVPVHNRFTTPAAASGGNSVFWYSFSLGSIHVSSLSSEHDWTAGSEQYRWLAADLAAVNRTKTPWLVLTLHRPPYFSESKHPGQEEVGMHLRSNLEPLLMKYNVDLVLSGHMHMYERTTPVVNGTVAGTLADPRGPVYAVIGAGGIELDTAPWSAPRPTWSAARNETTYGYARVTAMNASHLHWEFVTTPGGLVIDDQWVVSKHSFAQQ